MTDKKRRFRPPEDRPQPRSVSQLVEVLDRSMNELLGQVSKESRDLVFALYTASLVVAINGPDQISSQLAKRALSWDAGRGKLSKDHEAAERTRRLVKWSEAPKSRVPEGNAFEQIAKVEGVSKATVERRAYKKRKPN